LYDIGQELPRRLIGIGCQSISLKRSIFRAGHVAEGNEFTLSQYEMWWHRA